VSDYLEAFSLGNAAILGNVCMLPLYPGLFVLLANRVEAGGSSRSVRWMGVLVLAGVLASMVALGGILHALSRAVSDVLDVLLPVMYGLVALLGVLMLLDRNPFTRVTTMRLPIVSSPTGLAVVYGLMLGPLTLPCTGPLVISAFVLGGVRGSGAFLDSLAYFLAFGLGFGWPLVVLPFLAAPVQRQLTGLLGRFHRGITVVSGLLLLAVAAAGWWYDIRPN
jgi:cytochrome c-type biogenesis protein